MHIRRHQGALLSLSKGALCIWRDVMVKFQDAYPSSATLTLSLVLRIVGKRAHLCHRTSHQPTCATIQYVVSF